MLIHNIDRSKEKKKSDTDSKPLLELSLFVFFLRHLTIAFVVELSNPHETSITIELVSTRINEIRWAPAGDTKFIGGAFEFNKAKLLLAYYYLFNCMG